ncbi:MAG: MBL fold metallo-hydrolase [Ruminococcaceae bacterium]|nr:MBL fold metallo-hydrolase [Oscillospiraceae bacterium]
MGYEYKRFTEGMLGSNTYVLWDTDTLEALIIDTGNSPAEPAEFISKNNLKVKYIVFTHGHYDHVCYIEAYKEIFGVPVACTPEENKNLSMPYLNASVLFGSAVVYKPGDVLVDEGFVFNLGKSDGPVVIRTPGHTSGGICILAGKLLFTGDTLFYNSFGRTDLGDGSTPVLRASVEKLYEMEDDIVILPGHGTKSTIKREREENPFWDF